MSAKSKIEWTDATWNPVRGCSRVSEGCRNCYAERVAGRFSNPGFPYEGLAAMEFHPRPQGDGKFHARWTGKVEFVEERLADPLRWRKPRRIFVNSMSDLFHESVPDEWIDRIFAVMAHCSVEWHRCRAKDCDHEPCNENSLERRLPHVFQVLTKRPERMLKYLSSNGRRERIMDTFSSLGWYFEFPPILNSTWPLPNVWLGVSVEDQKTADERIPLLLQTPAAVRWISVEPLLGPVNLHRWFDVVPVGFPRIFPLAHTAGVATPLIDWVVCGGESGPGARPMYPGWARSVRDQCQAAGVPFFFKQWGEWAPETFAHADRPKAEAKEGMARVGKRAAGRLLDGHEWDDFPEARAARP